MFYFFKITKRIGSNADHLKFYSFYKSEPVFAHPSLTNFLQLSFFEKKNEGVENWNCPREMKIRKMINGGGQKLMHYFWSAKNVLFEY